jgi:hypothetical protein
MVSPVAGLMTAWWLTSHLLSQSGGLPKIIAWYEPIMVAEFVKANEASERLAGWFRRGG